MRGTHKTQEWPLAIGHIREEQCGHGKGIAPEEIADRQVKHAKTHGGNRRSQLR